MSCNDLDLVWELDSCYWLEKLVTLYTVRRCGAGGGVLAAAVAVAPVAAAPYVLRTLAKRAPPSRSHTLALFASQSEPAVPWLSLSSLHPIACCCQDLKVLPEEALPPDGADSWVMSSYLLRR